MENFQQNVMSVIVNKDIQELNQLVISLQYALVKNHFEMDSLSSELIDLEFIEQVKDVVSQGFKLYFGKTLRDLKCAIIDENSTVHEVFFQYRGDKNLVITSMNIPNTVLLDKVYSTIEELAVDCKLHIDCLSNYFKELSQIDRFCAVVDPVIPTFKEPYRIIMLDDRVWLHLEVTSEGLANNVHIVGQSELWQDKLQVGLLLWDHDLDIVNNIMTIFDITDFPHLPNMVSTDSITEQGEAEIEPHQIMCSICLCNELPGLGVPQPLCQNPICGVFFHRNCLFEWLVTCTGGCLPAFGVAAGDCPSCFEIITCSEMD